MPDSPADFYGCGLPFDILYRSGDTSDTTVGDTTVGDTTVGDTTTGGTGDTEKPIEFVDFTELSGMKIIIPDNCDKRIYDASQELFMYLMSEKEITLQKGTDGSKKGTPAPEGTAEILLGATNRPESAGKTYAFGDFSVSYENGRIAINGGSIPAILNGVEWFKTNCLGETLQRPKGTYTHIHEYTMTNVKLYGELLSNYRAESTDFPKEAQYLNEYIAMNVGGVNENAQKVITLKNDTETIPSSSAVVRKADNGMLIAVCGKIIDIEKAVQILKDELESRTTNELSIDKTEKIDLGDGIETLSKLQLNEWRQETEDRIEEIRSTPNMEIPAGSTVYYVSNSGNDDNDGRTSKTAWATFKNVNEKALGYGSYVCFERGGLWRGQQITAQEGVTYTAYGEGEKPRFYRSERNVGGEENWELVSGNIWKLKDFDKKGVWNDVGTLVFNDGADGCAVKVLKTVRGENINMNVTRNEPFTTYKDLKHDLDFYHAIHSGEDGYGGLYLYSTKGNPGKRFESIEVNLKCDTSYIGGSQTGIISVKGGVDDVTVDNICFKYSGSHGVKGQTVKNLTVTNCEFGWIGGSILDETTRDHS